MPAPEGSILVSTKKALGIFEDDTSFDTDIIMHINSVFATLNQIDVGPVESFEILDDTTIWSQFIGNNPNIGFVKSYMYLKVRLLFDPPTLGYVITSYEKQIDEFYFRLQVASEGKPK